MILPTHSDFSLEQAALKAATAQKAAVVEAVALAVENYRVEAAATLAKSVAREADINSIPTLTARVDALENQVRASVSMLDAKIVDFDTPIHWLKRNWPIVVGIVATNAAITPMLLHFLR